jgi:hypothetical protein
VYRILNEHDDAITRSIRAPQEEVTTDFELTGALARASGYLMFSGTGALTLGTAFVPTTATVSSFMETVLDDTTAAAARTTLGAYGSGDSIVATDITTKGPWRDVRAYGATGDGATDDVTALKAAITDCSVGDVLYFPPATDYDCSDTLSIPAGVHVWMEADLNYTGSDNEAAITVPVSSTTYSGMIYKIRVKRATLSDWSNEGVIGFQLHGRVVASDITILKASGFTIGVQLDGSSGEYIGYNTIKLLNLQDNQIGLDITNDTSGWVNDNVFVGGNFQVTSSQAARTGTDRYGIRFDSDGTSYNQGNVFYKPSFNLDTDATHDAVPVLANYGRVNRVWDARTEGSDTEVLQCANESFGNLVETPYRAADVNDASTPVGDDRTLHNVAIGCLYSTTGLIANRYASLVWHSGNLLDRITAVDGATNYHIPGIAHFNSGTAIVSSYPSWKSFAVPQSVSGYFTPAAGDGIGVLVDTVTAKKLLVRRDVDSGFNGRIAVIPYDSSGNILTDNPAVPHVLSRDWAWSATAWGGSYAQPSDTQDTDIYIELGSSVEKAAIILINGTADLRIRSFSIYTINTSPFNKDAAVYSGYEDVFPGARLIDGTTPTTGTFELGAVLWDKTAAASTQAGLVCSASGTFSAATDATGDTDGSTATITGMADTSDFSVGDYVTVTAGFGTNSPLGETIFKILDVQSTTITLDTASDSAQSNVTVATPDPVFEPLAAHQT